MSKIQFPCEIVVWKILPAIKSKIVQNLKEKGIKQKDIAKVLDITEAAVSQYLSGKRAKDYKIPDKFNEMINVVSEAIAEGKNRQILMYGICQICKEIRKSGSACSICQYDSKGCNLCICNE